MKLDQILPEAPSIEITGLTADSRRVAPGFLFAALKGATADGRDYVEMAIEKGAVAILTDLREGDWSVPSLKVEEPRLALAHLAAGFYGRQPETVIAVTGTNGKSSTVDFLRQIWAHCGRSAASMGTLGVVTPQGAVDLGHTTPDPVAVQSTMATLSQEGVTHAAMEASSHGLEQYRMHGVKLSAAAFTNLTQDHLDYHPTFDAYRNAKLKLFGELLPADAPAVINMDSPEKAAFVAVAKARNQKLFRVGWRGTELKLAELTPRSTGQTLRLQGEFGERDILLPLIGEFQALNALTAAGLAISLGEAAPDVLDAMEKLQGVKGRLELVGESPSGAAIFVDYAHTPDGLETLLRAARPHTAGRLICVFGCGGDRDPYKRPMMGEVAASLADEVIVTDDNPRSEEPAAIRAAILAKVPAATEIGDRAAAILEGVKRLEAGDALLIAGKGHEVGQIIKGETVPFSDHDAARNAIAAVSQEGRHG